MEKGMEFKTELTFEEKSTIDYEAENNYPDKYSTIHNIVERIITDRLTALTAEHEAEKAELEKKVIEAIAKKNICAICNRINQADCVDGFCTKLDIIAKITQSIKSAFGGGK